MRTLLGKLGVVCIALAFVMVAMTTDADARRYYGGHGHHGHHFNPLWVPLAVAGAVFGTAAIASTLAPYPRYYSPSPAYYGPYPYSCRRSCGSYGYYNNYGDWGPGY